MSILRELCNYPEYPLWSSMIRNYYWHVRNTRRFDSVKLRRLYRYIAAEKKRLNAEGVDAEIVRLLCRHLVNLKNTRAQYRFWQAYFKYIQLPLF